MLEVLKKNPLVTIFVEDEIIINMKLVHGKVNNHIIIDSKVPVSLVSQVWVNYYLRLMKVMKKKQLMKESRLHE